MVASEKTDLSNAVRICKTLLLSYFINQILRSETEKKEGKNYFRLASMFRIYLFFTDSKMDIFL